MMTPRERIRATLAGDPADRAGFWLGNPHDETWPILRDHFGAADGESVRRRLNDDFRWIGADSAYRHPDGLEMFDTRPRSDSLSAAGAFADCEDVAEVDAWPWPDPDHLDFGGILGQLDAAGEHYRATGMWSPFFHIVADYFGMENYFVKMYTHPDVVHAVTSRVVGFYVEANRRFFGEAGEKADGFFFGNDFGSQRDLLISPEAFREFVMPYFRQLTDLGHEFGRQVILHSCGSIAKVIPDLVEAGVDALHPLQAKAVGMDAESLASSFAGRIAFVGGIDTQDLLVRGTPDEVRAEVRRVRDILGPSVVISPSHEALLPNVPPENVAAMAEAATSG